MIRVMQQKRLFCWVMLSAMGLSLVAAQSSQQEKQPYNILLIAVDDLNSWIGAMGGPAQTPNMDALAARGRLFTNAHCVTPACNPSRTALMTGQRPETTGQYGNPGNFRELPGGLQRVTLPQFLQNKGFETVAAGKIFHQPAGKGKTPNVLSDPESWTHQNPNNVGTGGHDVFLDEYGQARWLEGAMRKDIKGNAGAPYLTKFGVWGITSETKEETADWQNARFCADFLAQPQDKPFLLACGIFRPHSPQIVPKEFMDKYPLHQVQAPVFPEDDMKDLPAIAQTNFSSEFVSWVKRKGQLQLAMQAYLASISYADACIGEVLNALENSPYKNNTVVILFSDHGWQLGHKDRWEKYSLWRQATSMPLIISYPGMPSKGAVCEQAVSLLDIYPTVLSLNGWSLPEYLEGLTLKPQLERPGARRRQPAVVTFPQGNHAVIQGRWHYIHYEDGTEELYDQRLDRGQYYNLITQKRAGKIKRRLKVSLPQ